MPAAISRTSPKILPAGRVAGPLHDESTGRNHSPLLLSVAHGLLGSNLVLFQLAIQRSLADTKQARRQKFVAIELGNGVEDRVSLQL